MATVVNEPKDTRFEGLAALGVKAFEGFQQAKKRDRLDAELDSIVNVIQGGDVNAGRQALLNASPQFQRDPRFKTAQEGFNIANPDRTPVVVYGPSNQTKTVLFDPKRDIQPQVDALGPGFTTGKKPAVTVRHKDGTFGATFIDPNQAAAALRITQRLDPGATLISASSRDAEIKIRELKVKEKNANTAAASARNTSSSTALGREAREATITAGLAADTSATRTGIINRETHHKQLNSELAASLGGTVSETGAVSFTNTDLNDPYIRSLALGDTIMDRGGSLPLARDTASVATLIESITADIDTSTLGAAEKGVSEATGAPLESSRASRIFKDRIGIDYTEWQKLELNALADESTPQYTGGAINRDKATGVKFIKIRNRIYPIPR